MVDACNSSVLVESSCCGRDVDYIRVTGGRNQGLDDLAESPAIRILNADAGIHQIRCDSVDCWLGDASAVDGELQARSARTARERRRSPGKRAGCARSHISRQSAIVHVLGIQVIVEYLKCVAY